MLAQIYASEDEFQDNLLWVDLIAVIKWLCYIIPMIKLIASKNEYIAKLLVHEGLPFSAVSKLLRKKDIKINDKRINKNIKVNQGDEIIAYAEPPKRYEVVFEDQNIIIVNKSMGIATVGENSLETLLKQNEPNITACHRIDTNTAGLVIFSKTTEAHKEILDAFKKGLINKYYLGLVSGTPKEKAATLSAYLTKDAENSVVTISQTKTPDSKSVKTNYELLSSFGDISALKIQIITGRTHQIRAHLAFAGYPVLGDNKYGDRIINQKYHVHKQCLCAYKLEFNFNGTLKYLNEKTFEIKPYFADLLADIKF